MSRGSRLVGKCSACRRTAKHVVIEQAVWHYLPRNMSMHALLDGTVVRGAALLLRYGTVWDVVNCEEQG